MTAPAASDCRQISSQVTTLYRPNAAAYQALASLYIYAVLGLRHLVQVTFISSNAGTFQTANDTFRALKVTLLAH